MRKQDKTKTINKAKKRLYQIKPLFKLESFKINPQGRAKALHLQSL